MLELGDSDSPRPRVAGLILAAGASARMGRVKALVELEGRSFLAHGLELLRRAGCRPLVVVEGAHGLGPLPDPEATLVHNPRWQLGPLSSLQAGLAVLAQTEVDGAVVHHVERPRVRVETVRALIRAFASEPQVYWQPRHAGRSGHPVLWPASLFAELAARDPAVASARELLSRPEIAVLRRKLEVDDPGVLDNIDTPAQLEELHSSSSGASE